MHGQQNIKVYGLYVTAVAQRQESGPAFAGKATSRTQWLSSSQLLSRLKGSTKPSVLAVAGY